MSQGLVAHCTELLAALGSVRSRRMFGGHGFYVDGVFLALIAFDRLFLKTNAETAPAYAAAGGEPFVYTGQGKSVTMGYWTVPAQAMESPEAMLPWARLAMQAGLAARAAKAPRSKAVAAKSASALRKRK